MKAGSKHDPKSLAKMSDSHKVQKNTRKGFKSSDETRAKISRARAEGVHPRLARRGITKEMFDAAARDGLKWCCGECKSFIELVRFRKSQCLRCRDCESRKSDKQRARRSPERRLEIIAACKKWHLDRPEYERRFRLLHRYGVTPEWYAETLEKQDGHCALCPDFNAHAGSIKFLFVDHCHATGRVRGLLCAKCNTYLGILEAAPDWPERARSYLERHG